MRSDSTCGRGKRERDLLLRPPIALHFSCPKEGSRVKFAQYTSSHLLPTFPVSTYGVSVPICHCFCLFLRCVCLRLSFFGVTFLRLWSSRLGANLRCYESSSFSTEEGDLRKAVVHAYRARPAKQIPSASFLVLRFVLCHFLASSLISGSFNRFSFPGCEIETVFWYWAMKAGWLVSSEQAVRPFQPESKNSSCESLASRKFPVIGQPFLARDDSRFWL